MNTTVPTTNTTHEKEYICIYHYPCNDGFAAALVVREALGKKNVWMHPTNYGKPLIPLNLIADKKVIIVDFSYKRENMITLAEHAKSILVLDHHKTAEKELVDLPSNVTTIFNMDKSGAVMAWEQFFPYTPVPKLLQHIQDRDLWKFNIPGTQDVIAWLSSYQFDFATWGTFIDYIFYENCSEMEQGAAIRRKMMKDIGEHIFHNTSTARIAEYIVPVINAPPIWASDTGHQLAIGYPFAAIYQDSGVDRNFSLRSAEEGIDVAKIAELFGGGGHKHAAGFSIPQVELIFNSDGEMVINPDGYKTRVYIK